MSTSKFAGLEGVDYAAPDVFETRSPSPSRRNKGIRGGARGAYGSSSDDDASDDDQDDSSGLDDGDERNARRSNKKIGGRGGVASHGAGFSSMRDRAADTSPDIERTHLDANEAAKRFQDAPGVDGSNVDFTAKIQRRRRKPQYYPRSDATFETSSYTLGSGTGYRTVYSADEENGSGAAPGLRVSNKHESHLDRFRRLRYEMQELERELQQDPKDLQGSSAGEDGKDEKDEDERDHADLLLQLQALREHSMRVEASHHLEEDDSGHKGHKWQDEAHKLLDQLSKPKDASQPGDTLESSVQKKEGAAAEIKVSETERLADVDHRLASLEDLVGVQIALQDEAKSMPRPLLPSLARIEHLLTLLTQPRHLDGISRRIKVLVSELERAHDARRKLAAATGDTSAAAIAAAGGSGHAGGNDAAVPMPADTLKRLDSVLPLLSKIEPMIPVVPTLLARLQTLSSLHASSANFAHDVEALTDLARASRQHNDELSSMLANVESSFVENKTRIQSNFAAMQERMDALMKRIEALSS